MKNTNRYQYIETENLKDSLAGHPSVKKWWKCATWYKVIRTDKGKKEEHACGEYLGNSCDKYVMDDHLCYLRATPAKDHYISKFIFFDFECSQNESGIRGRVDCQSQHVFKSFSKCQNCKTSWCGKATHWPNFVMAHTVCPKCIDKPLAPKFVCKSCGTRCKECDKIDLYENKAEGPCLGKCGFKEVTFEKAE